MELLEAAIRYAELGYAVFPCAPGGQVPITQRGLLDATTDTDVIEQWWRENQYANIGLRTDGLLVVDIDTSDNPWLRDDPEKMLSLSSGPIAITPRGGSHRIFRCPENKNYRNTASKIAPSVDTRAAGGYIVVSPSSRPDGMYQWLDGSELDCPLLQLPEPPQWLQDLLDTQSAPRQFPADANMIPDGQRNATLASLGGAMRRVGMSQSEIFSAIWTANNDRCNPPLPRQEVEKIAWSVARYEPDQTSVAVTEHHYEQDFDDSPAENRITDPGPFPEHLLHVPGFIGQVMQHNLSTAPKPQPILALASALCLLSVLTGRKVQSDSGIRTNIYAIGVAGSGAGKDHARKLNHKILAVAGLDKMMGSPKAASASGLMNAVAMSPAILWQWDEIGRILHSISSSGAGNPHDYHIVTKLMQLYTSSDSVVRTDEYADQKNKKVIDQPHAVLYGTTVSKSLYESFTNENMIDGFMSRLMIFDAGGHDPMAMTSRKQDPTIEIVNAARWWGEFSPGGNLSQEHPQPITVEFADEAREISRQMNMFSHEKKQETTSEAVKTIWSRYYEQSVKLALLWACSVNPDAPEIDVTAMTWGKEMMDYQIAKRLHIGEVWVSDNAYEATLKRILREIDKHKSGIGRRDLRKRFRSLRSKDFEEAMQALEETGSVRIETMQTGGRPITKYIAI